MTSPCGRAVNIRLMRSELLSFEESFLSFTPHTIHALSRPLGTARVVSAPTLSSTEAALLSYFRRHPGRVLSREELAEQVWKQRHFYGSRTIDQTVSKLRKKLRREEAKILSVWAAGYRFESSESGRVKAKHFGGRNSAAHHH